jgi:hypothetical protein
MSESVSTALVVQLTKRELAESRLYPNIKTPAQAAVVLAKARSYGLDPTTVADGLFFVGGKPSMSAQLIATLLKKSGKYDYRVIEKTEKQCIIDFFEVGHTSREKLGREVFTMAMATRAGLGSNANWKKFPEAMLWARCLTAGVRAHCPDALGGNPVYSVEELRPEVSVDADGRPVLAADVVDAEVVDATPCTSSGRSPAHADVTQLIEETATDKGALLNYYKVFAVEDLTTAQVSHAINTLRLKKEGMDK